MDAVERLLKEAQRYLDLAAERLERAKALTENLDPGQESPGELVSGAS